MVSIVMLKCSQETMSHCSLLPLSFKLWRMRHGYIWVGQAGRARYAMTHLPHRCAIAYPVPINNPRCLAIKSITKARNYRPCYLRKSYWNFCWILVCKDKRMFHRHFDKLHLLRRIWSFHTVHFGIAPHTGYFQIHMNIRLHLSYYIYFERIL